jgi:hypothetical protein
LSWPISEPMRNQPAGMRTKFGSQELDGGAADEIGREDIGEYLNLFFK